MFPPEEESEEPATVSSVAPADTAETQSFKFPEPTSGRPEEDIDLTDDSELESLPSFWHEHADEIWGTPHAGNGSDNALIEIQEEEGEEPVATEQTRAAETKPGALRQEPPPPAIFDEEPESADEAELQPVDLDEIMSRPVEVPAFLRDEFQPDSAPPEEVIESQVQAQPTEEFVLPPAAEDEPARDRQVPPAVLASPPVAPEPTVKPQPAPEAPPKPKAAPAPKPKAASAEPAAKPKIATPQVAPAEPVAGTGDEASARRIALALTRLCASRGLAKPKLVVIGRERDHLSAMVRHLLGPQAGVRKVENATFQHLEIGERILESGEPLEVIGVSMEQQFTQLLQAVAHDLVGYILLLQADRRDDLSYCGYLLNVLKAGYHLPFGVAVIRENDKRSLATATVRDLVNAEPADFLLDFVPSDAASVAAFVEGLASDANLTRW